MFSILESYGAELSPHIVFVLKTSGYVSFRALSKITAEKIVEIQKFIQTLFSDKTLTDKLSKEDKISQFGPLYWNKPERFMFTLGDSDSIQGAVEVSKKLIEGETLPTLKLPQAAIFQTKKSTYRNPASNPALTLAQKTLAETSQIKEKLPTETSQKNKKLSKPFIASFSEWLTKQEELIFDKTNLSFDETNGIVTCLLCKVKISTSINVETGNWRISNVTRHVSVSITPKSLLILTFKQSFNVLFSFILENTQQNKTKQSRMWSSQ